MPFKPHSTVQTASPYKFIHLVAKSNAYSESKTVNLYWGNFQKLFSCYIVFTTSEFCVLELIRVTANRKVIPESDKEDREEVKSLD